MSKEGIKGVTKESPLDRSITSSIMMELLDEEDPQEQQQEQQEQQEAVFGTTVPPWQYHWKRLSLTHVSSNLNQENCHLLKDKVPIQTVSARLTEEEVETIMTNCKSMNDSSPLYTNNNNDNNDDGNHHKDTPMPWEELESSSEDEQEQEYEQEQEQEYETHLFQKDIPSRQEGHVISITIFVSKSFLQHVQEDGCLQDDGTAKDGHPSDDIIVPADTILIEIIKDVYWKKDDSRTATTTDTINDTVQIVHRKVLYWPKALMTNHYHGGKTHLHTPQDSQTRRNPIQSIQQMIQNAIASKAQDTTQEQNHQRRKQQCWKEIQQMEGVTGMTLVRSQPTKYDKIGTVDVDEIVDLLVQLNLGIDSQVDAEHLAMILHQNRRRSNDLYDWNHTQDTEEEENGDLILSCICNDGNIQLFSVLDLLEDWNPSTNATNQIQSVVDVICGNDKEHEAFLSQFESFIIGKDVLLSLQKSVLPLSTPIATIPLAISFIKDERISRKESKLSKQKTMDRPMDTLQDISMIYDDHQPHMDFSTIDSTFEPSTLSDKTTNNVVTLSCAAFGYVAVAGKGLRRIRRYEYIDQDLNSRYRSKVEAVPGGFVTLISTLYYTESRTIFVPFEPLLIRPVYWNRMQLLIVCGKSTHECVGIRLDSSSFVSFEQKLNSEYIKNGSRRYRKRQEQHYIRKFVPIHINLHIDMEVPTEGFIPLSITDTFCDPPSIIICSCVSKTLKIQKISLDSFNLQKSNVYQNTQGSISTRWDSRNFVALDLDVDEIDMARQIVNKNVWCISGQGWSLLNVHNMSKYKLFSITWDGASQDRGSFYTEIMNMNRSSENLLECISNVKLHGLMEQCRMSHVLPDYQVSVGYIREDNPCVNLQLSLRSNICPRVISSSFEEIIDWLCSRHDYRTAACIALSLLEDKEGLFDIHGDHGNACEYEASPFEGILDGITIPTKTPETFIKLSNITISCLVNGGSVMTHTLDNFLGRNTYYDASVACQILVDCIVNTISELSAKDMSHLAPYSYNPLVSHGHALWPVQCLLRVAVSKDCMEIALDMLNQNIPDVLRHRCPTMQEDSHTNRYLSCLSLSKSIISMILAASNDSASYLMQIVEEGTCKFFWDSLDQETRLSLSLLFVQGKYPLLREVDVREWVLGLLHRATGLMERSDHEDSNESLSSDFLRGICSGVTCNAGCDLSQTTFMTADLFQDDLNISSRDQEGELFEYICKNSYETGGVDYDLLIPSLLLLKKRETYWLANQKMPLQSIVNVVCDLAGRPIVKEEKFITNFSDLMKQTVLMENPLAAANLIGGVNGMILKCVHALVVEAGITVLEAEDYLLRSKENDENPIVLNGDTETRANNFKLTEGHKLLLSLLEKHVLSVRKFGAFAQSSSRGHVHPVIAARICLKSWFYLAQKFPESGPWIETWLTDRLNLDIDTDNTKLRLPSAALIRALLWDEVSTDVEKEPKTSNMGLCLGFSRSFLIRLARSSCGLLESVPSSVASSPVQE